MEVEGRSKARHALWDLRIPNAGLTRCTKLLTHSVLRIWERLAHLLDLQVRDSTGAAVSCQSVLRVRIPSSLRNLFLLKRASLIAWGPHPLWRATCFPQSQVMNRLNTTKTPVAPPASGHCGSVAPWFRGSGCPEVLWPRGSVAPAAPGHLHSVIAGFSQSCTLLPTPPSV